MGVKAETGNIDVKPMDYEKWETVRIFISSTFRDMHAERDYLVNSVFPKLRDWCTQYRLHLYDIDLRWGLDSSEDDVVTEVCTRLIDDCHPLFISMLGDRYGYISSSGSSRSKLSITHKEIEHVICDEKNFPYLYFYFRHLDEQSIEDACSSIDEESKSVFLKTYFEPDKDSTKQLTSLKQHIKALYSGQEDEHVFNYTGFVSLKEGRPYVSQESLEAFGDRVYHDLSAAICRLFKGRINWYDENQNRTSDMDDFESIRDEVDHGFYGREKELKGILDFIASPSAPAYLVLGPKSSGKTWLLMQAYNILIKNTISTDTIIVPMFMQWMENRACNVKGPWAHVCKALSISTPQYDSDGNLYKPSLNDVCVYLKANNKKLLLIVDDSLYSRSIIGSLSPDSCGGRLHVIASCEWKDTSQPPYWAKENHEYYVNGRQPVVLTYMLPPPGVDECIAIIRIYLGTYGKSLGSGLAESLLPIINDKSLLYQRLLAEDMRTFGDYDHLKQYVLSLPKTASELFNRRVDIIVNYFSQNRRTQLNINIAEHFLGLLACSRNGLTMNELRKMLPEFASNLEVLARYCRNLLFFQAERVLIMSPELSSCLKDRLNRLGVITSIYGQLAYLSISVWEPYAENAEDPEKLSACTDVYYYSSRANLELFAEKALEGLREYNRKLYGSSYDDCVRYSEGSIDLKAACHICGTPGIRHDHQDWSGSVDSHDFYFSWCPVCHWADTFNEYNMYGEPAAEFDYSTNSYQSWWY